MHPSDRLLSDLDDWTARSAKDTDARRAEALRLVLSRHLRGLPPEILSGVAEYWTFLRRGPDGGRNAKAWAEAAGLLFLGDYDGDPPLGREDWAQLREIVSAEAETLDMDILSYVMERVLEHGGF